MERYAALILLLALLGPAGAAAQPTGGVVEEVRAAYQRLDHEAARARAVAALEQGDLRLEQRTELHTILALIAYTRTEPDEARRQFGLALDLSPGLALDPLLVSPKVQAFFEDVKRDRALRDEAAGRVAGAPPEVRYVVLRDNRSDAALRSMLVPGWGQLYKGETRKGWLLAGLWGATASATLFAHYRRGQAEDAYLAERVPSAVAGRYATFDRWHKVRNNLVLGATAVWMYSYVDALLHRPPAPDASARAHLSVAPTGVSLHVTF